MSVRWSQDDHRLVIHQKGSLTARLFGLPFLAAAGIMGWHFMTGLLGFVDPTQGALTPAGLVILPIFVLAFGTPGWILVFGRSRIEIDPTTRLVVEVRDFHLHRFRAETTIPRGAGVRTCIEAVQSAGRTTDHLLVEIASKDEMPIQIAVFLPTEATPARDLARTLAGLLGARLIDDIEKGAQAPSWDDPDEEGR